MNGFYTNGGIEYAKGLETEFKATLAKLEHRLENAEGAPMRFMIDQEIEQLRAEYGTALAAIGRMLF